jgi:hypothetical protein
MSGARKTAARHEKPCRPHPSCYALVMWFEEPVRALADPVQFLAHVMVFGTVEDLQALCGIVHNDDYRDVLEHAPPGIFDARSQNW